MSKQIDGFTVLKTINSHAGKYRWLAELDEMPVGYIPRVMAIPSPYASSPTDIVWKWNGRNVISRETRHKYYQVFEVPADVRIYTDEQSAVDEHIARGRKPGVINWTRNRPQEKPSL